MVGIIHPIEMIRGDTFNLEIRLINQSTGESYLEPGDTVYFTVKKSINTEDVLIQKILTIFPDDRIVVHLTPEDTKNLKYGNYIYDMQLTKVNNSEVFTFIKPSDFSIEGEVTYD